MRTLELLKPLKKKELKQIEEKVAQGKRKNLVLLLKELKKYRLRTDLPDRSGLFKKVFGKAYSVKKDYLLRNELRLLNKVIYDFLVMDCVTEQIAKNQSLYNRLLAQSYYNRKMKLFTEDINGFIQQAKKDVQTDEALLMYALRTRWSGVYDVATKEQVIAGVLEWKEEEKRRLLHRLRKIEYNLAFFEVNMGERKPRPANSPDDWSVKGETHIDLTETERHDWYARYLTLQKLIWQSKGEPQLKYLEEIIALGNSERAAKAIPDDSRVVSIEVLAFQLFMGGKHQQADKYIEEALKLRKKYRQTPLPANITIYIANQIILQRYQQAAALWPVYEHMLQKSLSYTHCLMLTGYAYLFMAQPDEAMQILTGNTTLFSDEVIQTRYMYMIAFILRKQYDLAWSEIKNLKRILPTIAVSSPENENAIAGHFYTFISAMQKNKPLQGKQLAGFKQQLTHTLHAYKGSPLHTIQLRWLMRFLKAEE